MRVFIFALLFFAFNVQAQRIQSDCLPAESLIITSPAFVEQVAGPGRLLASDCTDGPGGKLFVVMVINVPAGVESYLLVFGRKGLTVQSKPLFKSQPLGFDAFPMLVNERRRLLFVKNENGSKTVAIYMNIQTGPATTRLGRWDLDLANSKLSEHLQRAWPMDAGRIPKIHKHDNAWRALIGKRSVEL